MTLACCEADCVGHEACMGACPPSASESNQGVPRPKHSPAFFARRGQCVCPVRVDLQSNVADKN